MLAKLNTKLSLHKINNVLLASIIIVNLYTITAPLAPAIVFWWQKQHSQRTQQLSRNIETPPLMSTPVSNRYTLTVPSMMLDTPIHEGPTTAMYETLDKGVWRWPDSSTPDKGSNTVLIGHRFTYTNPDGIFYHLNKVHTGDTIGVFWAGKQYVYKVSSITTVSPTKTSILNPTPGSQLTLYTCTPTWNPKQRLVVVAKLESIRGPQTT